MTVARQKFGPGKQTHRMTWPLVMVEMVICVVVTVYVNCGTVAALVASTTRQFGAALYVFWNVTLPEVADDVQLPARSVDVLATVHPVAPDVGPVGASDGNVSVVRGGMSNPCPYAADASKPSAIAAEKMPRSIPCIVNLR